MSKNIVVSPVAIVTAQYLEKIFGTPYEIAYPLVEELLPEMDYTNKKILVVHQQVIADSVCRGAAEQRGRKCSDSRLVHDEKGTSQGGGYSTSR